MRHLIEAWNTRPTPGQDGLGDRIEELLKEYRAQYTEDDEGRGLPLVDILSPGETVKEGLQEIELLADYLASELSIPPSPTSTGERE